MLAHAYWATVWFTKYLLVTAYALMMPVHPYAYAEQVKPHMVTECATQEIVFHDCYVDTRGVDYRGHGSIVRVPDGNTYDVFIQGTREGM